jgi:hypothetical protein
VEVRIEMGSQEWAGWIGLRRAVESGRGERREGREIREERAYIPADVDVLDGHDMLVAADKSHVTLQLSDC